MAVNRKKNKKKTIKMSQGKLRMKYPTRVNSNTDRNSHVL